ncbi:MAG: tetratricopeptide repeat protein [Candidatus Krumholzibacteria bacterium]|nr:tetratricopeptide repeat protein [Candidatus Krumholzibacteria bacterium]
MNLKTHKEDDFSWAARYYKIVLLTVAALTIVLQVAALGPLRNSFWGFHIYAFLPLAAAIVCWTVVLLATIAFLRPAREGELHGCRIVPLDGRPLVSALVFALACGAVFWIFRSQQTLLGDAHPLITNLPKGQDFHPRQPVTMWLQQVLYQNLGGYFRREGIEDSEVARHVVAVGSVVVGFLYAFVAFALGRTLARETSHKNAVSWMVTLLLISQGYALLFFGYVENYTFYTLFIATYLLTAVLYLNRRLTLQIVAVVFLATVSLHLSAFGLFPSFLFLVAWGLYRRDRRRDAITAVVLTVVGLFILNVILRAMSSDFALWAGLQQMIHIARSSQGGGGGVGLAYMFSSLHVRDFANEHFLIGPLAAFLFVPALVIALYKRSLHAPVGVFLSLTALSFLAGSWTMSEPLLGYARDWDLFAPAAVCYSTAGLYFLLRHVRGGQAATRLLAFSLIFSLVQLVPWVWLNHSESLSLTRFKTLPLGYGRTEVVVANWYLRHNQLDEGAEWLRRAVKVNPSNANAYNLLGNLFVERGQLELAGEAYRGAITYRPDKIEFRHNYVGLMLKLERYEDVLSDLRWLCEREPENLRYWKSFRDVLERLGRTDELPEVKENMLRLFEKRLLENRRDGDALIETGVLLADLGRYDEALLRFRRALEIDPRSAAALFNAGSLLTRLGRPREARPLLEKFIELYPEHSMTEWAREQVGR